MTTTKKLYGFNTIQFPSGPPPQYYEGSTHFNFRVQMGSGAFCVIWSNPNSFIHSFLHSQVDKLVQRNLLAVWRTF